MKSILRENIKYYCQFYPAIEIFNFTILEQSFSNKNSTHLHAVMHSCPE